MKSLPAIVLCMLLCLIVPATASAEWGNKCNAKLHCYGIARFKMKGTGAGNGEEAEAMSSEIVTDAMNVPGWEVGEGATSYVVTNEQWMRAPKGNWVEDGQLAGDKNATEEGKEVNGKSLHWFYAYNNRVSEGVNNYHEYNSPWTYPGWTPEAYALNDPNRNGTWCEIIGSVQVNCDGNYAMYATEVEIGMEAGDEQQPENMGYVQNTGVENQWGEWEYWKKAEIETINKMLQSEAGYTCAKSIASHPGYISFGTPANECF